MTKEIEAAVKAFKNSFLPKRGFKLTTQYANDTDLLPQRSTKHAAGYDLKAAKFVRIEPGEIALIPLGVKVYMQEGEVLYLYDRSSNPRKKGIVMVNSVGVIDCDYYDNPDNEGLIYAQVQNITDKAVTIARGDRIAQGVFVPHLLADGDQADGERKGGFGSTGQ